MHTLDFMEANTLIVPLNELVLGWVSDIGGIVIFSQSNGPDLMIDVDSSKAAAQEAEGCLEELVTLINANYEVSGEKKVLDYQYLHLTLDKD